MQKRVLRVISLLRDVPFWHDKILCAFDAIAKVPRENSIFLKERSCKDGVLSCEGGDGVKKIDEGVDWQEATGVLGEIFVPKTFSKEEELCSTINIFLS